MRTSFERSRSPLGLVLENASIVSLELTAMKWLDFGSADDR